MYRMYKFIVISTLLELSNCVWMPDGNGFPKLILEPIVCERYNITETNICDPDKILGLLGGGRVQSIINEISELKDECGDRYEVAVAIVKELDFFTGTADDAVMDFAKSIHNKWRVGSAKCKTGIVFALSEKDRTFYFSVGPGVKNIMTKRRIENMDSMEKYYDDGKWGMNVTEIMMDVKKILEMGPYEETWCDTRRDPEGCRFVASLPLKAVKLGVVIFLAFAIVIGCEEAYKLFSSYLKKRKRLNDDKINFKKKNDDAAHFL